MITQLPQVTSTRAGYSPFSRGLHESISYTACASFNSRIPRQVGWNLFARTIPFASAFPETGAGRLLHCRFRGLLSVYSGYGLHARQVTYATLYTDGFSSFVASAAASIATGWSEPVPGRV
jgi:hypothetical protein